jgi:hypothetical protein
MVRNEVKRTQDEAAKWFTADVRASIDAQLERALAFVTTDDGSPEQAQRELTIARGLAARAMSARIDDLLEATTSPAGMDAGSWGELQAQVRAILAGVGTQAPDAALQAVRDADQHLVRGLVGAARTKLSADRQKIGASPSPADKDRAAALDGILGHLDDARAALARGDLAAAHTAYDDARTGLSAARTSGFLGAAAATLAVPDLPPAPGPPAAATVMVPSAVVTPLPDVADVQRQWRWYEGLIFVLTLAVGVAVGLLALYVGKPTWGSLGDVLLALLWGAGLYQVTGALQQGFIGVRTALTG